MTLTFGEMLPAEAAAVLAVPNCIAKWENLQDVDRDLADKDVVGVQRATLEPDNTQQ